MPSYPSLIHERVALANAGKNSTAIARLRSGWVVLGDDQRLPGYSLLLSDPVVDTLNSLGEKERKIFLWEMSLIGDALNSIFEPSIINYSIYGNQERALHAHVHPRYDSEEKEMRGTVPFIYIMKKKPIVPFDPERDKEVMVRIREYLGGKTEIIG